MFNLIWSRTNHIAVKHATCKSNIHLWVKYEARTDAYTAEKRATDETKNTEAEYMDKWSNLQKEKVKMETILYNNYVQ